MCLAEEGAGSESEYMKLVELMQSAENATGTNEEGVVLDLDKAVAVQPVESTGSYTQLVELIESVEGGRQKAKEVQKQKAPEPQEHIIMSGLEQAKYSNPVPSFTAKEEEAARKEFEALKEKLGGIAPKIRELKRPRVKSGDLVLPTLSLTDQISELERIIEGIKENIFDKEHLDIVKLEVFGLNEIIERSERAKRKQAKAANAEAATTIEESLVQVRNQRLAEAVTLLQNR